MCLAVCAPAPADAGLELPPPDLLEFLGEFGSDDGGLIDPTRLPAAPSAPGTPPAAPTTGGSSDAHR